MHDLDAFYYDILGALAKSRQLEKRASEGDDQALRQKVAQDLNTLGMVKEAINWAEVSPLTKGLLGGAGAAVPLAIGGTLVANHAADRARNNALQVALGVGGVGAGLIALNHALKPKQAATEEASVDPALLTKLATVGYIDAVLDEVEKTADDNTRTDVYAMRCLNAEHCTHLLEELLGG